ncbi:APC family permease [Pseudonocardia asaccharolytica]|uniref:Amino acid permease n=2 Tax=Pseudonocardia asaccharolytica TaxID=54010 RepID=A0A511CVC8_9PSEU|nr:APC family permease [Pseudonocardia asaccharolytica]GEL16529.1 amino acid permease [Pseudonocardia asaccharolytica DSM 44247 = NBRC 16224]
MQQDSGRILAELRLRSPVHGLARRHLGPLDVFAQSVSGAAPAAAMSATPVIVAATAGPATTWSFLVATVLALLIGTCIGRFTRRMAAAGSLYSLTAKGLGPGWAFGCGVALLVGYGALAMAALAGAAIYLDTLIVRAGLGAPGSRPVLVTAVCALAILAVTLALVGVRLSARVVLLVEAISISLMVLIFAVLLGSEGSSGVPPADAVPGPGLGGIAAGVLPALAAFIGFEAATALGVEARRPFQTIPRAVQWTAGISGLLYLFAAYTQVVGFADVPGGLAGQTEPVPQLAAAHGRLWLSVLLDLGIAMSFFACALATGSALVRVLFSMARDGIAPAAFGATHRRYRTPHVAIAVALPIAAGVPALLLALGMPAGRVLSELLTVATVGYLVAYLLVCLAAPLFLRRIGELTTPPVVVTAVIVPILLVVLIAFVVSSLGRPLPIVAGLLVVVGAVWLVWLRLRRPDRLAGIGAYDETVAADVFDERQVGIR